MSFSFFFWGGGGGARGTIYFLKVHLDGSWLFLFSLEGVKMFCFVFWWILPAQPRRSGESARLPPMCSRFNSRTRRHVWAGFVGSLLCSERFFSGYSGFPLSSKTNIWFDLIWFDLIYVDLQSSQLVEHMCSAGKIWDFNKAVIIIQGLSCYPLA